MGVNLANGVLMGNYWHGHWYLHEVGGMMGSAYGMGSSLSLTWHYLLTEVYARMDESTLVLELGFHSSACWCASGRSVDLVSY